MAKVLAPEDLRVGDYVALLHVVREMPLVLVVRRGRPRSSPKSPFAFHSCSKTAASRT